MGSASFAYRTRYPPFREAEPKRNGDSKKRPLTLMTLTDIKRPQAIAVYCKYLVYQVPSGVSVSQGTLCLTMHPIMCTREYASLGCRTQGQKVRGGLALTSSV